MRYQIFQNSELGQLYSQLPLKELSKLLPAKRDKRGAKPRFNNSGKIALQFLKSYLSLSDTKLLARINTDWALQMFCGFQIG